ncbi:transposase [Microcoleus sp. B9-D4]|uniref:transposase n=1 Tax=Microcoleus sp. B9-D4 TaxID=2818711 RepID=UPI004040BF2E
MAIAKNVKKYFANSIVSRLYPTNELSWPENLIPVCQPSHSPELNPIERVWEYIKKELVGEVFTTREQLRERLKQVLEKITRSQISSLSSYKFILEALFYTTSY